jgi:NAD(P)-dependent dehydrogenase (short-subunit alcohol dehydrogenase family)
MASGERAPGKVLVTGAASGIGAAIVERLAADGWSVMGADLAPANGPGEHTAADLSDEAQCQAVAERARGATALVHAAGFMRTGDLGALDPADGDAMWAVHVRALTLLAQALVPAMPSGGRLLAIGSRTSAGSPGKSQYAACKAAVTALVRSWAIELAPRGITANVIAPAATDTPLLSDPARAAVAPAVPPIGRLIEPREIAAYAAFILSRDADAVTGQELLICGGASL